VLRDLFEILKQTRHDEADLIAHIAEVDARELPLVLPARQLRDAAPGGVLLTRSSAGSKGRRSSSCCPETSS
jgi:hypothetical protein